MEIKLIRVYEDLLELTSALAQDIFIDYYTPINGKQHATYMAEKFLSVQALKEEIDSDTVLKLVLVNNQPGGFLEYKLDNDRVFLSKLYLHKDYRHQKIGSKMLSDVIEYTKENNKRAIYLTVNKHNNTKKLYDHWGFKVIDSVVTDIGNNYVMDDYIMELNI